MIKSCLMPSREMCCLLSAFVLYAGMTTIILNSSAYHMDPSIYVIFSMNIVVITGCLCRVILCRREPLLEESPLYMTYTGDVECCAICLEGSEKVSVPRLPNCAHAFHNECLHSLVESGHTSCPLCRSALLIKGKEAVV